MSPKVRPHNRIHNCLYPPLLPLSDFSGVVWGKVDFSRVVQWKVGFSMEWHISAGLCRERHISVRFTGKGGFQKGWQQKAHFSKVVWIKLRFGWVGQNLLHLWAHAVLYPIMGPMMLYTISARFANAQHNDRPLYPLRWIRKCCHHCNSLMENCQSDMLRTFVYALHPIK